MPESLPFCEKCGLQAEEIRAHVIGYDWVNGEREIVYRAQCPKKHWWNRHSTFSKGYGQNRLWEKDTVG